MNNNKKEKITIVGAGPVGSLLAIFLSRAGYQINLIESRSDPRKNHLSQGKSINIALSNRAWLALEKIGLKEQIRQQAVPMYKRVTHAIDGSTIEQKYNINGEAIWSVYRTTINEQLLDLAELEKNISLQFEQRLTHIDFNTGCTVFCFNKDPRKGHREIEADYVFAADGAFSKIRRLAQETPRFSYSQTYLSQCYIELTIAANEDGSSKISNDALHIWSRENFMLIALPNNDGSFTCTLFLPYENNEASFTLLKSKAQIGHFFKKNFSDAMHLLENPIDEFLAQTATPLFVVNIDPWVINNKVALIGDAAHAMVPFYGQGMNCSFEDCKELAELIDTYQGDWNKILPAYQQQRKSNADAMTELSQQNFIQMSTKTADAKWLLAKKIEEKFHQIYPELWQPLDSMITFSAQISYTKAIAIDKKQQECMTEIMKIENIEQRWQQSFVYAKLVKLITNKLMTND
ncbi:MAG: FAD-dependent monooxygenase [Colwellia sp.]